jgi:hypothetical protein
MKKIQKIRDPFQFLYEGKKPIESLGKLYEHPKDGFENGQEYLIATVKGQGDGQTVEVYEIRLPSRFFILKVQPGNNSIGEPQEPYEVGTGSGEAEFVGQIAIAIANGMLVFKTSKGD